MESGRVRTPVRVHNFPGSLDDGVGFDGMDQLRSKTARVESEQAGSSAQVNYDIPRFYSTSQRLQVSTRANAILDHFSVSGKIIEIHGSYRELFVLSRTENES